MSRLIDADELMRTLGITDMDCGKCAWGENQFCTRGSDFTDACCAIEDALTIEERKKGRWIPHPNPENREWDVCTACGTGCKRREYGRYPDECVTEYNYPFCPNCGAEMRGGEDDKV